MVITYGLDGRPYRTYAYSTASEQCSIVLDHGNNVILRFVEQRHLTLCNTRYSLAYRTRGWITKRVCDMQVKDYND